VAVVLWLLAAAAPVRLRARARFPGALAQLLLVAYATLTITTLQLLSCVDLPGGERVLFLAGATSCGAWQAPLKMLLAVLVLLPGAPLLVFGARRLPAHWQLAKKACAAHFPAHATAQALRTSLTKEFTAEYWHWGALLALQRFAMVATPIFFTDTLASSIILAFVAFFMQNLQLHFAPYVNADVNKLQKLAADCLLALALLNIPQRVLEQASVDVDAPSEAPLKVVCDRLEDAMALFLLAPLLLPLLALALESAGGAVSGAAQSSGDKGTDLTEPLLPLDGSALALRPSAGSGSGQRQAFGTPEAEYNSVHSTGSSNA
jgi:hypothetical protein